MKALVRLELTLVGALMLTGPSPAPALAQDHGGHPPMVQGPQTAEQQQQAGALLRIVKQATARFTDVRVAQGEGYNLLFGCVSGGDFGAMGLHYVNLSLVGDGLIDATKPEIILYEPARKEVYAFNGRGKSATIIDAQTGKVVATVPLEGKPVGNFSNWNPNVSCDGFSGATQ